MKCHLCGREHPVALCDVRWELLEKGVWYDRVTKALWFVERSEEVDKATVAARIRGEQNRTIGNIMARTERPRKAWWLSFAGADGFRGAVIVHAEDFMTALMECSLRSLNPHGECQGIEIPSEKTPQIPESWKYRLLNSEQCAAFDEEMSKIDDQPPGAER